MYYKNKIRSLHLKKITRVVCGTCIILFICQFLNGAWKIENDTSNGSTYNYTFINKNFAPDADVITNDDKIFISDGIKFENRSFAENKFWFQEKITHTEDLPLSEYTNQTKRILFWNKDFTNSAL